MECQATFKEHCQWPKCDCDRIAVCVLPDVCYCDVVADKQECIDLGYCKMDRPELTERQNGST